MIRTSVLAVLAVAVPLAAQAQPCFARFDNATFTDNISTGGPNLLIGIRDTTGNAPLTVFALEVFTGEGNGTNTLGIWTHDAANNRPGIDLGTASFPMSTVNAWQGVNLNAPITIPANTTFWLVWGPVNGAQTSIAQQNAVSGQPYRGSFDGGASWNGPFVNYDWKYRLWCQPIFPARFATFGRSCAGSARTSPSIGATGLPSLGQPMTITVARALPTTPAYACFGFSNQLWAGTVPLPFDLTPLGATSCSVFVDLEAAFSMPTDATGASSITFNVPNQPSLLGRDIFAQWVCIDPAANALGLVTSNAGTMTIGT